MFEDFSSEMVSQVALLLLIGIAFGLLFDTSAVSLERSCEWRPRAVGRRRKSYRRLRVTVYVWLANPMCRKERPLL